MCGVPPSKSSVPPTQVMPELRGLHPLGVAVNAEGRVKLEERAARLLFFVHFFLPSSLTSSLLSPFSAAGRSAVKASLAEATSRDFCARPAICNRACSSVALFPRNPSVPRRCGATLRLKRARRVPLLCRPPLLCVLLHLPIDISLFSFLIARRALFFSCLLGCWFCW